MQNLKLIIKSNINFVGEMLKYNYEHNIKLLLRELKKKSYIYTKKI